jgi:hypothetical protein
MKRAIAYLLVISLGLLLKSCNTTEPPPPPDGEKPTLELKLEDVSCTEAWITLSTSNLQLPATVTLLQAGETRETINVETKDTLLYIDSLLPNTNYQYQASSIQYRVSSNELSVTTMDTTSHNFTFETFTFGGEAGSCTFYDVAIINENYIIAVGTVFLTDSLGQPDPQPYGVAVWNGQIWELKKIFHSTNIPVTPRGIFVISPNEIYLAAGSIFRWDGISSTVQMVFSRLSLPNPNATIEKLWGSSNSSIYGVGNAGSIVFFNGTLWSRIESGTELNFHDIYGATDPKTGEQQILAVCSRNLPLGKGIYRIQENTVVEISSAPIQWELYAVWFIPNRHYFVIGNGIYEKKFLTDFLWKDNGFDITHYATTGIRGNGLNDVFIAGAFGEFLHFNGITWKSYINELGWFSGSYGGVAVKDNMVITVGYESAKAKILIGKK